jgi:hypothetical protein
VPRLRTTLLAAIVFICLALWLGSYAYYSYARRAARDSSTAMILSDRGAVYLTWTAPAPSSRRASRWYFRAGRSSSDHALEDEFAVAVQRWKPLRYIERNNGLLVRVVILPWWTITAASAAPALWAWRKRRREHTRGFEVETPSNTISTPHSPDNTPPHSGQPPEY